jgi:predicted glycosyltransferase
LHTALSVHQPEGDYILVTTGGGGDGADLVEDVLSAYEHDESLTHKALIVLGPYMPGEQRAALMLRGRKIKHIKMIEFDTRMEELIASSKAVVSMGGYNTYCEILSFDRPALIVPRTTPREEQLIRAKRAAELGMIQMLMPEEAGDPQRMAQALKSLPDQPPPSQAPHGMLLEGLTNIIQIVGRDLTLRTAKRRAARAKK